MKASNAANHCELRCFKGNRVTTFNIQKTSGDFAGASNTLRMGPTELPQLVWLENNPHQKDRIHQPLSTGCQEWTKTLKSWNPPKSFWHLDTKAKMKEWLFAYDHSMKPMVLQKAFRSPLNRPIPYPIGWGQPLDVAATMTTWCELLWKLIHFHVGYPSWRPCQNLRATLQKPACHHVYNSHLEYTGRQYHCPLVNTFQSKRQQCVNLDVFVPNHENLSIQTPCYIFKPPGGTKAKSKTRTFGIKMIKMCEHCSQQWGPLELAGSLQLPVKVTMARIGTAGLVSWNPYLSTGPTFKREQIRCVDSIGSFWYLDDHCHSSNLENHITDLRLPSWIKYHRPDTGWNPLAGSLDGRSRNDGHLQDDQVASGGNTPLSGQTSGA